MIRTVSARIGAALFLGVAVLGLSACGSSTPTVDAESAQKAVSDAVEQNTEETAKDVKCPSDIEAKVDAVFDCTYAASDGENYVAHLTITKVDKDQVFYNITSDLA